ncbi:MAG: DUF11 domain-containing protein, partial [Gemmatimonadetes bacterium]|nr:DUF11 domain-containing protein [Gemmatimonadota bacterium]
TVVAPILTTSTKTSTDVNGGVLAPGDTLRYTIAVNNTGAGTARNVTVRDTLDTNVAAVANLGPAVIEDAGPPIAIRWDAGTIAGNDADTLVFDAVLAFPIDDGTDILNEALITSDEAEPFTTAQTSDAVTSAVDFSTIAKTWADDDGGLIQPGDTITFTFTIPNTGDMNATGVTITDALPTFGIDYVPGSTTLNGGGVADDAGPASPVEAGMTVNSPGEGAGIVAAADTAVVTLRMRLADDVPPSTNIDNSFDLVDDQGSNETAAAPTLTVGGSSHQVLLTSASTASSCETIPFTIDMIPSGLAAFDVYFEFVVPAGFSFVSGSVNVTNSGNGGSDTSDPDISGNTWRFNYSGSPNPGNNLVYDVNPDDTLSVTFDMIAETCEPGNNAFQNTTNYKNGASAPYVVLVPAASTSIDILEGAMTLTSEPVAPAAAVGDSISDTLTIASVGFGDIGNVTVRHTLEKNLTYLPTETSPAPDSVIANGDGSTTLVWIPDSTTSLQTIVSGSDVVFVVGSRLDDCTDYDQFTQATWGCGSEPCQDITTNISVNLLLDEPVISFSLSPDPISVPSCDALGVDVTFTVINSGGNANDMVVSLAGLSPLVALTNLAGADSAVGTSPIELYLGDIAPDDTVDVTFTLSHENNCSFPSGSLVFSPTYTNDCGAPYSLPNLISSYSTSSDYGLTLDKTGPIEILDGDTASFTLTLCYTGPGPPPTDITVTDIYPSFLTFLGDESPAATTGGAYADTASTWIFPAVGIAGDTCITITYSLIATGACNSEGSNSASAMMTTPCGTDTCVVNASASQYTGIDCPDDIVNCLPELLHVVNGASDVTEEVCVPQTYVSTMDFSGAGASGVTFGNLTYKAWARHGKEILGYRQMDSTYVYGVARFTVATSGGDSCWIDLEPVRDGSDYLSWDLSPLDSLFESPNCIGTPPTNLANVTITAEYDLTSDSTLAYHYEYAQLTVSGSAGCDGTITEPVQVTIARSSMGATLNVPAIVEECVADSVTLTVTKSGSYASYDNVLYLSEDDFEYIDDPDDPDYFLPIFTNLPNVGVPTRIGDVGNGTPGVYWKLGDLPDSLTSGTIVMPLRKRCTDGDSYVRIVYDD